MFRTQITCVSGISPYDIIYLATFSKSRFRDDGDGNDRESLGNRSRRPRQYSSTLVVICATATATTEALRRLSFKDLRELLVLSYISNVFGGEGFVLLRPYFFA